jgi:integrase
MGNTLEYWGKKLEESTPEILPENFKTLKKHIRKLESGRVKERSIVNHIQALIPFAKWCKVNFTVLVDDDIYEYCEHLAKMTFKRGKKELKYKPATVYAHKAYIKTFLKPINIAASNSVMLKREKRELPEILNEADTEAMIKAATNSRDKAMISVLFESGMRRGEITSLRLKDITFDENGVVIVISKSKTGPRRVRLVYSASYLREWISVHPKQDDREAILFCALRDPYPVMSEGGLHDQLVRMAKRAGIKKPVNPHAWRHAAATRLARHLTEQELKVYLGWTQSSSMAATYVHLAGEDIDDSILKIHGIVIEESKSDTLKIDRCPRCKEINPVKSLYCFKCGFILNENEMYSSGVQEIQELKAELEKFKSRDSDIQMLKDEIKKLKDKELKINQMNQEIKHILAIKYEPNYPKDRDISEYIINHQINMRLDPEYKQLYEETEKAVKSLYSDNRDEFDKALAIEEQRNNERDKKLKNLIYEIADK